MDEDVGTGVGPSERAHDAGGAGPTPECRRRMSARRKQDAVLRLLRGEDLELLSRQLGVTGGRFEQLAERLPGTENAAPWPHHGQGKGAQEVGEIGTSGLVRRLGGTKGVERVEVTGSRLVGNEDSMVSTRINLGNEGSPHNVEWRVRQGDAGHRIIDVVAEGVSLAVTTRNEFGAIVSQRGMDGLLAQLRERRALPSQQQPTA